MKNNIGAILFWTIVVIALVSISFNEAKKSQVSNSSVPIASGSGAISKGSVTVRDSRSVVGGFVAEVQCDYGKEFQEILDKTTGDERTISVRPEGRVGFSSNDFLVCFDHYPELDGWVVWGFGASTSPGYIDFNFHRDPSKKIYKLDIR